ncbi:MAG: hypothetical protein ACFFA8_03685 [Promethearchaeota archaeon]
MYRYTLNHQGATVGWHYTQIKPWKQEAPFTRGLYLSGHWTGPSGIPAVIQSGKNAVELILRHEN